MDRSDAADARRFRWLLGGNLGLFNDWIWLTDHIAVNQDAARGAIDDEIEQQAERLEMLEEIEAEAERDA